MKIAIIGSGQMGGGFARALLKKKLVASNELLIIEREREARQVFENLSCPVSPDITREIVKYDLVLLSTKPQDFGALSADLAAAISPTQILLSVMAGTSIARMKQALGTQQKIVRAMPNLPASIGFGVTAYYAESDVSASDLELALAIIDSVGVSLRVNSEELIDAATAISGTGPAYLYFFLEALMDKAEAIGFSQAEARLLVEHTFHGALHLLQSEGVPAAELRRRVTSKGGTTEAAVKHLETEGVKENFQLAVQAAFDRATSFK